MSRFAAKGEADMAKEGGNEEDIVLFNYFLLWSLTLGISAPECSTAFVLGSEKASHYFVWKDTCVMCSKLQRGKVSWCLSEASGNTAKTVEFLSGH